MKVDGSVIIDTRIVDGGMEKGFEAIKNEMNTVGLTAEKVGEKLQLAFSGKVNAPIENAIAKVQQLEEKLAVATEGFYSASYADDDNGAEKWASKREVIYDQLEDARRKLSQVVVREAEKEKAAEEKAAKKTAAEREKAFKKATKGATSFGKRLASIATSALLFNVISKGLRSVTEYFGKALKTNQKFNEAASDLKGALLTAFQPLYETVLPGIITGMQVLAKYALMVGEFFSALAGKDSSQMKDNAEALYDQANATEETANAAKKAKKALAGFDEINALQNKSTETTTDTQDPNFELNDIDLDSKLAEMARLGSEALFAVGLILLLSGANIPLGLGMTVAGAIGIYESFEEAWGGVEGDVITTAESIAFAADVILFAIGIIITLACPTKLALGIGMIVAGTAGMGYEVALNWGGVKEKLQDSLTAATSIVVGTVLIIIGLLCLVAQKWVTGIALIAEGAVFIGITIAANWNAIKEGLQKPLGAAIAVFAGTVLIVLGIFCCVAQMWVLGIGLIAAGAAFLGYTVAVNWNAIVDAMQGPLGKIVAIVSGALLVLGIILLLTGAGIPLGLGLILAGAAGLATAVAFNWNSIVDWVKNAWNKVKEFWNKHIAQVFTGKFWLDLAKKCGNGLIGGFEGAINGIISMFESMINWVVNGLNKISFDVPDWVPGIGGSTFGFSIPEVKFNRVSIPRLAQGAVIPPNREFMAVLGDQRHGTNIEAPLETIKQALAEVLAMQGGGETNVNVTFTGDLAQLARVLKPAIETETRRKGGSLAKGATF